MKFLSISILVVLFSTGAFADVTDADNFPSNVPAGTTVTLNIPINFRPGVTCERIQNGTELDENDATTDNDYFCQIDVSSSSNQDRTLQPRTMSFDPSAIKDPTNNGYFTIPVTGDSSVTAIHCFRFGVGYPVTIGMARAALKSAGMTLNLSQPVDF